MSTKRLATDAMFLTLALVVSYIEVLIPIPVGIPGIKLGLANGVIMVLLFFTTWIRTLEISVIRVVLAGFLFGNPMTIAYSLAGGILSLIVMGILKKIKGFSSVGISVGGGVAHNIGQLSIAVILMENTKIYYYAPVLLLTGTIAGVMIGVLSGVLVKKIPPQLFYKSLKFHQNHGNTICICAFISKIRIRSYKRKRNS